MAGLPLAGVTVADLTRQLPGPFAGRELLRLGARVTKIEPPGGDSMATAAPGWYDALNAGKEIVCWDARSEPRRRRSWRRMSCSRASGRASGSASASRCRPRPSSARSPGSAPRAACGRRGARSELPRLRGRTRRHGARRPAAADRRPRRRRAGSGDRGARGAPRARANGPRRADRRVDDARRRISSSLIAWPATRCRAS